MQPEEFQKRVNVSPETMDKFRAYEAFLIKWQAAINLISPSTLNDIWRRHFYDSAQLGALLPEGAKDILDIGSGAGFPGLVLALLKPELKITLVESDQRKAEFLRAVSRETGVKVQILNKRIEGVDKAHFDLVMARAFATLEDILGYFKNQSSAPNFLLLKGKTYEREIEDAWKSFDFTAKTYPSRTDPDAAILEISQVSSKEA